MDTSRLGEELLVLSKSEESKFAEIKALLESLTEDQRREVLRCNNEEVSLQKCINKMAVRFRWLVI